MEMQSPGQVSTPITFSLRLPLEVDLPGLLQDLARCLASEWRPHFNQRDYTGGWDSIALRSQDGKNTTVFAHPDAPYQDTPLLGECPHFQDVLKKIACEKESVRLLRQAPRGEIKTHRDIGLGYADGVFRLHIPLVTHPSVEFVVAGERLPMQPGECWFADFSQPHSVMNRSDSERIHLVIDCMRNEWTDAWFTGAGFDMESVAPKPMGAGDRRQMMAALREQDSPAAKALLAELENLAHLDTMLGFLDEIGIPWQLATVAEDSFLPGLEVRNGCLLIDKARLKFPGDILHEAGHIALVTPERRPHFTGNLAETLPEHKGDEMAVILWSYAACLHLGLSVDYVIHDSGYRDDADWLREELAKGNYIGLPLLVWMGLCLDPKKAGAAGFPQMLRWVR
jgi:hypothetical protein